MNAELEPAAGRNRASAKAPARPIVCVLGLGFVGTAMAVALSQARDRLGRPRFDIVGVELPTAEGERKVRAINSGGIPFSSADASLRTAAATAQRSGNLSATLQPDALAQAGVVVVDIPFGVDLSGGQPSLETESFERSIEALGDRIAPGTLVVIESTVPPGTCDKLVRPVLEARMLARGFAADDVLLAHSYERVMPGSEHLRSITQMPRVYAGATEEASTACQEFLGSFVDADITRLNSLIASETAKCLENSYRATNIALIDEWSRFAEASGIDLFEVIDAIRMRPTHRNIREPGFGVGGYCLTKDPLLAKLAAKEWFGLDMPFPFSTAAVETNRLMPRRSIEILERLLSGLENKRVLLLGVSYRPGVGDTRCSASLEFVQSARKRGAQIEAHDPFVNEWAELDMMLPAEFPEPEGFDAIVLAVAHEQYRRMRWENWLQGARPVVLDANRVLARDTRSRLRELGCRVESVGRGKGL